LIVPIYYHLATRHCFTRWIIAIFPTLYER
jgi:hypothetical protein